MKWSQQVHWCEFAGVSRLLNSGGYDQCLRPAVPRWQKSLACQRYYHGRYFPVVLG